MGVGMDARSAAVKNFLGYMAGPRYDEHQMRVLDSER
jgi:hypothetical protein